MSWLKGLFRGKEPDLMDSLFLDQFTPVDDGYLFRRNQRGAAYHCTPNERDSCLEDFRRSSRRLIWGVVAAVTIMVTATYAAGLDPDDPIAIFIYCSPLVALVPGTMIIYGAPEKALRRKPSVSPALSSEDAQRNYLQQTSWVPLGLITLIAGIVLGVLLLKASPWQGIDYIWGVGSALCLAQGLRSLWLKYRLARNSNQ
ncbi:hypothetical protein [Altererythrobacter lutimaris]|uniref:Uncharacterized protein n=1 Tax=Altererythrobacter lutimaris TaxID=2743979 RepID=A0A850H9X3_9SPHN|nr:hypothetical protein [Altererythrobacter lutimaris]NVE93751.1 hypothetical protein [Altererythrobacter lutimaris]